METVRSSISSELGPPYLTLRFARTAAQAIFRTGCVSVLSLLAIARAELPEGAAASVAPARFEFAAPHMGTLFRIVLFAPGPAEAKSAATAAFARVAELNRILSDYDPTSETMRLERHPAGTRVTVSPELFELLQRSQELAASSGGAFDVTLGPVVRLWREARRAQRLPTAAESAAARQAVGYEKLQLHPADRSVTLLSPGMQLDFGGIAKGYAADEALAVLARLGYARALVAASGDLALGDAPPGAAGWRIELRPFGGQMAEPWVFLAANVGISTSGDTEQFLEIEGIRHSHIVDPATARALTSPVAVTVIAPRAALSDGLATACSVLAVSAREQMSACVGHSARAIVLRRESDGQVSRETFGSSPSGLRTSL